MAGEFSRWNGHAEISGSCARRTPKGRIRQVYIKAREISTRATRLTPKDVLARSLSRRGREKDPPLLHTATTHTGR